MSEEETNRQKAKKAWIVQQNVFMLTGSDATCGKACKACVINTHAAISTMQPGEILMADMTDLDWVPATQIAMAVMMDFSDRSL